MSETGSNSARKSLKTFQPITLDHESLKGLKHQLSQASNSLKHQLRQEYPINREVKRKNLSSKESQAGTKVLVIDLTANPDDPTDNLWEIIAEERRVALQDALDENKRLHEIIDDLKQEITLIKELVEKANYFIVGVVKEDIAGTHDDTGIDVNDVSTADENIEIGDDEVSAPIADKK